MAKRTIANLNIKLGAHTASLRRDFQGAKGLVRTYGQAVEAIAGKITSAFDGIVSSLKGAVENQMGLIDGIAKFSDDVGISVKTMQAYRLQAELTGTSFQTLEKGLLVFVRRMGEAKTGMSRFGQGAEGLKLLDLQPAQLAAMDTAAAFELVADRIAALPDPASRAAAAYALFGRQGQELITLFNSGAEGLAAAREEIDKMGVGLSRVDAAKVEAANDAITRMKVAGAGMTAQLTVKLAPAITAITGAITQLTAWLGNLDGTTVANTAKIVGFTVAFIGVVKLIPKIVAGIRAIIATLKALAGAQAITSAMAGPAGWAK